MISTATTHWGLDHDQSRAHGVPVIFLHGGEADKTMFRDLLPLMGEDIRAIAYDQRDAPTKPAPGPYTMYDHAEDCVALIKALGLTKAHLVGMSYGGAIAMTAAITHPGAVASLTLGASAPCAEMMNPAVATAAYGLPAEQRQRKLLELLLTPVAIETRPDLVDLAGTGSPKRSDEASKRRFAAFLAHDCRDRLAQIALPTLLLHGSDDEVISPDVARWTAAQIDGATLRILSGLRHGIALEGREQVADIIRGFVLSVEGASA